VRSRLATPLWRRIVFITLFAWLPLLLLSLLAGTAWAGGTLPFLYDIEMHARFLVALPLLIGAELLVHLRLRRVVAQFIERDIITQAVLPRFKALIASAMQLRNSVIVEITMSLNSTASGSAAVPPLMNPSSAAATSNLWLTSATASR
jgi:hypothetical protein